MAFHTPSLDETTNIVELCSGIGGIGEGAQAGCMDTKARVELWEALVTLMRNQGVTHAIQGDVLSKQTIRDIHALYGGSSIVTACFPCQPWSALGGKKKTEDCRSQVLTGILETAYFPPCSALLLECVCAANDDVNVRQCIADWCKLTGYHVRDCHLDLKTVWPSNRKRWWVLVSYPGSCPPKLEALPRLPVPPTVQDILPAFPIWPDAALNQLSWGNYL